MEAPPPSDAKKLPDMVMCGDHPSFNKTELNAKEATVEDKEKSILQDRPMLSFTKISPVTSRVDGAQEWKLESRVRAASEHALRMREARRRVRELELQRPELAAAPTRPIVQALGSFRWPPYLLAVWVLVLVLTHLLHCLVGVLEKALPNLKKFSQYFRAWTESTWTSCQSDINQKLCPVALATITGLLYATYYALYALYAVVLWAVEPLCPDSEQCYGDMETKVIDYVEDVQSKINESVKQ